MEEFDSNLDASSLKTPDAINYNTVFLELLLNIYKCYEKLVLDKINVPNNDENKIRDILLLDYLIDTNVRNKFCNIYNFRFEKEVDENDGRVDIKIIDKNDFENFKAYYIIECKRLDGYSALNKEYIKNGINRFLSGKYSSHYKINGMIGFIVKDMDIDKNIKKIGNFFNIIEKDKVYDSNHKNLKLYHLMMDFSNNIKTNDKL